MDSCRIPNATPGIRDVDYPCSGFHPENKVWFLGCMGDGHYICGECASYYYSGDSERCKTCGTEGGENPRCHACRDFNPLKQ